MNAKHKRQFMQRHEAMKEAAASHPYAKWLAVPSPSTDAACMALHGKVWKVDGAALSATVREHLDGDIKNCSCRITPLRHSGQAEDELAYRAQQAVSRPPLESTKKALKRNAAVRQAVRESVAVSNARTVATLVPSEGWFDRLKREIGLK